MIQDKIRRFLERKREEETQQHTTQYDKLLTVLTTERDYEVDFSSFIGQEDVIEILDLEVKACMELGSTLDHVLIYGLPGLGKSLLATAIANEVDGLMKKISGTSLSRRDVVDSVEAFLNLQTAQNKILFIDEIHGVNRKIAETLLYDAMQDFRIRGKRIPPFTLVGATTYAGSIDEPLRHRFSVCVHMQPSKSSDLAQIIMKEHPQIPLGVAIYISQRSKGLTRLALNYSRMILKASTGSMFGVEMDHAEYVMGVLKVNDEGLTADDIKVLEILASENRSLSKNTICAMVRIEMSEYETLIEPTLLSRNLIAISSKGRIITDTGRNYLCH